MKKRFDQKELKELPLNLILSIPKERISPNLSALGENGEFTYDSGLHQNKHKLVFEGFYKSITRKI